MQPSPVRLPQPCPANWSAMTPTVAGRHCAACCTEVVDFTQKSPAEVVAYLRQENGRRICGRVYAAQLAAAPGSRWRRWAGALLAVSSLSATLLPKAAARAPLALASINAQPARTSSGVFQEAPGPLKKLKKRLAVSRIVVRGVVLDARTHTPAPGVTILVKGTNWGTSTNADGRFELTVVPKGRHIELVVAFVGYKTFVKKLSVTESSDLITILLKNDTVMLGRISAPATPQSRFLARLRNFCRGS